MTLDSCLVYALIALLALLVAGLVYLVLRAIGKVGPHRDIEAWSVRSPDAVSEDRRVAAQRARLATQRVSDEELYSYARARAARHAADMERRGREHEKGRPEWKT